jgi:hypothetical protein
VIRQTVVVLLAALVAPAAGLVASPASAAPVAFSYTLTAGDPTMTTSLGSDSQPCSAGVASGPYAYQVVRIKASVSGSYQLVDAGPADGRLGIYTGAFDPVNPLTNCAAFIDVDESVALSAATVYTLVKSSSSSAIGTFNWTYDGPGAITEVVTSTTTLTTDPNPSELSKPTTLKAVVAGGTTPTGTVQFKDGATVLGSAALVSGVARLSVKKLAVGSHTLSATFAGDAGHEGSTDTYVHKVKYGPKPKVKLSVSDATVFVGQVITLKWASKKADKVKASGDWKGKRAKKGTAKVRIKSLGAFIFKLKATNVNGADKARIKVVATRAPKEFTVNVLDEVLTAGARVQVRATKLDPRERFKVFLDDIEAPLFKGFADKKGLASALVTLPKTLTEGEHTIKVMGSNKDRQGSLDVFVLAATKDLGLSFAKAEVKIGKKQTVTVSGLTDGEEVTLTYDGDALTSGVADANGEFKYTFSVGSSTGVRTVSAVGALPGRNGDGTFVVLT